MFLFISLPLSLALTESSRTLLPDVFGGRYGSSVPVLEILAWSIVLTFLNYLLWYGLIAVRQERPALLVDLGGLSANVTVNALAIPALGARGAAAALIVSEAVVLLGQSALIHRRLFALPVRELLAKPVAAAAVAVPSAIFVGHRSPVAGGLTGGLVYVAILLGLGYVRVSELRPAFASLRPTARP
jgi:O-antigen/teichoic acid export membrane protein